MSADRLCLCGQLSTATCHSHSAPQLLTSSALTRELRSRYGYVRPKDTCCLSGAPLLSNPFVLFPCGHAMHANALIQHLVDHASKARVNIIETMQVKNYIYI